MTRRTSTWTRVYMDPSHGDQPFYVRLTPDFVELEKTGFNHGLSMGSTTFETKAEAEAWADRLDTFFEAVKAAIIKDAIATGRLS